MTNTLLDLYFITSILSLCVILMLCKRQDVILLRYERKEEYKGFLKDVLMTVLSTGGILNPAVIVPWFDFSDKDEFEKKHLVSKNWLLLLFLIIFCGMFMVGYLITH